jgi:NIPSNAP
LITCFLRYVIEPDKLAEFEQYARTWMRLIEKFGGTHHGYFVADETPPTASFSFPGIGEEGASNVAIALFSFPTVEAYETYREKVASDPECHAATAHYEATKFFTSYERTFMRAIDRG